MNRILYEQKITNTIVYKNKGKGKQDDDYNKIYTKAKYIFGLCFHKHHFEEDLSTNGDTTSKPVGFKNGD